MNSISKLYKVKDIDKKLEYTLNELIQDGVTKKDIEYLTFYGYLKNNDNKYILTDTFFAKYAKKLKFFNRDEVSAQKCFLKSLEINPNNKSALLSFFIDILKKENFKESDFHHVVSIYSRLSIIDDYRYSDNNFYLFLLNYIGKLPDSCYEYLKLLEKENFLLSKREQPNDLERDIINKIRKKALNLDFRGAIKAYNDYAHIASSPANHITISRLLLFRAINSQNKYNERLNYLLYIGDYANALGYLEMLGRRNILSEKQELILISLRCLLNLITLDKVPQLINHKLITTTLDEAIKNHDFKKALEFAKEENYNEKNHLFVILKLINNISDSKIEKEEYPLDATFRDNYYMNAIKYYIRHFKLTEALLTMHKFLRIINKCEYESIMMTLIKLYLFSKNEYGKLFTKIMLNISKSDFEITDYLNINKEFNTLDDINIYLEKLIDPIEYEKKLERIM